VGAGRNPAALGLLFTWTRGTIVNTVLFFKVKQKHIPTVFTQQKRLLSVFLRNMSLWNALAVLRCTLGIIHIYLLYILYVLYSYIRSTLLCAKCEFADLVSHCQTRECVTSSVPDLLHFDTD
jgi:hypothetical protein